MNSTSVDGPKVSIVTVVRNAERTIADTILSVARQSYSNKEYVIADGASTDGTLDVIRHHSQYVTTLVSERDRGIYDGFNKGLSLVSGQIVGFLNADDVYEYADVLSDVVRVFVDRNVDAVFGDVVITDEGDLSRVRRHYRSRPPTRARLSMGLMPAHPALFVRRTLFDQYGGFDHTYKVAGDFAWVAQVFRSGVVSHEHLRRVLVRMRGGGASGQGVSSIVLNTKEIMRGCRSASIRTNYPLLLSRYFQKVGEFLWVARSSQAESVTDRAMWFRR